MSARHVRVAEETRKRKASALLVQPDAAIKSAVEIVLLCEQCNERPRAGRGGALRRCIECIRQAAEVDRLAREEAQRRHVAKLFELKPDVASKTCKSCHSMKPLAQFSKHRLSRDGHVHTCTGCTANSRQGSAPNYPSSRSRPTRLGEPSRIARRPTWLRLFAGRLSTQKPDTLVAR